VVHKYSSFAIRETVSAEKVEKVVRPPKKPVAIPILSISGRYVWFFVIAMKSPIKKPPSKLADNVPRGIVGKTEFKALPNKNLSRAPRPAPVNIAKSIIDYD
jgi:hypothetical protein